MTLKFIGLDLDGTLLNIRKKISKNIYFALDTFAKKNPNICGAIITGRYSNSTNKFCSQINNATKLFKISYVASSNGGCLYWVDYKNDRYHLITKHLIPCNLANSIYKLCIKHKVLFWGCLDNLYNGVPIVLSKHYISYLIKFIHFRDVCISKKFINDNYLKINVISPSKKKLDIFLKELNTIHLNAFQISRTHAKMFEITALGVNKGEAVKFICDKEKIKFEERVAIGDSPNDLMMWKNVKYKIAPINVKKTIRDQVDYIGKKRFKKRITCLFDDYLNKI